MFVPLCIAALSGLIQAAPEPAPTTPQEAVAGLAKGTIALGSLVDPAHGLIYVDHYDGPVDEPPKPVAKRFCGAKSAAERAALATRVHEDAKRVVEEADGATIPCGPAFGGTTCTVGATMEWDPAVHLVFDTVAATKTQAARVTLRAVLIDDDVLVSEELVQSQHAKLAAAAKRLGAGVCR